MCKAKNSPSPHDQAYIVFAFCFFFLIKRKVIMMIIKAIIIIIIIIIYFEFVAEGKNFKLLFSAGIVLAVEVSNLYISSNENDSGHSARMTSPGNIKGGVTFLRPLFLAYLSITTDRLSSSLTLLNDSSRINRPSQHEMSAFSFWASVLLGVHSFIIYSFPLDPLVLETSRLDV